MGSQDSYFVFLLDNDKCASWQKRCSDGKCVNSGSRCGEYSHFKIINEFMNLLCASDFERVDFSLGLVI